MTVNFVAKHRRKTKNKCPAFGKKCGRENHFAAKCKSRAETSRKCKPVHVVSEQDSDTYEDIMTLTEVNGDNETVNQVRKRATVKANNSLQE